MALAAAGFSLALGPAIEYVLVAGLFVVAAPAYLPFLASRFAVFRDVRSVGSVGEREDTGAFWAPAVLGRGVRLREALMAVAWLLAFFAIVQAIVLAVAQYEVWNAGASGAYFLPPHQPASYFLGYSWQHFGKNPFATLVFALACAVFMRGANARSGFRFFYEEEPWLAAVSILLVGWPLSLFAVIGTLWGAILFQVFRVCAARIRGGDSGRFPLVYFWLPCALAGMIWGDTIGTMLGISQFKF